MPSPSEIILASLGLQANALSQIAQAKNDTKRREIAAYGQISDSISKFGETLKKKRAEQEMSSLEELFSSTIATGKPETFARAAQTLELSTPEARQARLAFLGQARQYARQDVADERNEALFGLQVEQHERSGEIHDLNKKLLGGNIEDAAHARTRRVEVEAQQDEAHAARMEALRLEREIREEELSSTKEGKAVIDLTNLIGAKVDKVLDNLMAEGENALEMFDEADEMGGLDKYFDPTNPIAQKAKHEYRNRLQHRVAIQMEMDSAKRRAKQEVFQENLINAQTTWGGVALERARSQAMQAIKSHKFETPGDYASAYLQAYEGFKKWVDSVAPNSGISRNVLIETGVQEISGQLDKGLLRAFTTASKQAVGITPQQAAALINYREKYIQQRLAGAGNMLGNDEAVEAARQKFTAEYNRMVEELRAGRRSLADLGLDDTAIAKMNAESGEWQPDGLTNAIMLFMAEDKKFQGK